MKKFFLAILLLFCWCLTTQAQLLEDFEGGAPDLNWTGLNGTFNGAIFNPYQTGTNTSDYVGTYTNSPTADFSFALANLTQPIDLSKNNMIKMKVWSPTGSTATPAKLLFKFEGGGFNVEKFVDITVHNQWVEYSFDLSNGANLTTLNAILVSFNSFVLLDSATYYFDDIRLVKNERVLEDFETASGIIWTGLNGVFNGPVPNPDPDQFNSSATVGSATNSAAVDYSFVLGTLSQPLDLTTYNQFHLQLNVPKPTEVLFKLEGAGQSLEKRRNIAVTGKWQDYNFDMSEAADFTTITKILIVFSPGIVGAADTFYFDNLKVTPDMCPATAPDPEVIDDFECNRNATYSVGVDSLEIVKNPDPDANNPSACVAKWHRRTGTGTEFDALVITYDNPIDLSTANVFSVKIWSSKLGNILLKIEGGTSQKEVSLPIPAINEWVTYSVDFASEAGEGHTRFVIFFGAGANGAPGDVYYFDDIKLSAPSEVSVETFEPVSLIWQPQGGDPVLHGTFTAPTTNPEPNGVNNTAQVGCYTKGSSPFSSLQAFVTPPFDLSVFSQFNIDVLSPATGGVVTLQLVSTLEGNKEVDATVTTAGEWETLSFDFSAFGDVTDFGEINLIFNAGTAASGQQWCIDNLTQSKTTIDPCLGVTPDPTIVDDFECQRNFTSIFYGAADINPVINPHSTVENASTRVGEYIDPQGGFAGIGYQLAGPPDLTVRNQLQVQIWSPQANVPFLFKLQGGTTANEVFDTIPVANEWYTFNIDFSNAVGTDNSQLVIFFNVGNEAGGGTYYIDNVRFVRAAYNGCVSDFETAATSISNFVYFNQGAAYTTPFEIVPNPLPSGINTSSKVGKFVQASDAPQFTGMFAELDADIDFGGVKQMKVKVLMDHEGTFTMKVEVFGNPVPAIEIDQDITAAEVGIWVEKTFDFSVVADGDKYNRLTILVDKGSSAPGTNRVTYFDDIVIGDGMCTTVGTFQPLAVQPMTVSPNPATGTLRVENFGDISQLYVMNLYGQHVGQISVNGDQRLDVEVGQLPAGLYTLAGYNSEGRLVRNAKFVKQ